MTQTVTALYDTYDSAVSAVNALEASGVPHSDISIVSNNVDNRHSKDRPTNAAEDAGKGAGIGAAVGGVGGLLTGLGLLAIPGVGPVAAAGWLVATAAGCCATNRMRTRIASPANVPESSMCATRAVCRFTAAVGG